MASILIRDIPETLYQQIKTIADYDRRSVPAEVLHLTEMATRTRLLSLEESQQAVADLQRRLVTKPVMGRSVTDLLDEDRSR